MFSFLKPRVLRTAETFIEQCLPAAKVSLTLQDALPKGKEVPRALVQMCDKHGLGHLDLAVMLCDYAYEQALGAAELMKQSFSEKGEAVAKTGAMAAGARIAEHDRIFSAVFEAAFQTKRHEQPKKSVHPFIQFFIPN